MCVLIYNRSTIDLSGKGGMYVSYVSDEDWANFQQGIIENGLQNSHTATSTLSELTDTQKGEANIELARSILNDGAPYAAARIVQLAMHSSNERVQLDASKYITERVLGPAGQRIEGAKGPLQSMLENLFSEAEKHANGDEG